MKAKCPVCGLIFEPRGAGTRRQQRYCSNKCKLTCWRNGTIPDLAEVLAESERKYLEKSQEKKKICYG